MIEKGIIGFVGLRFLTIVLFAVTATVFGADYVCTEVPDSLNVSSPWSQWRELQDVTLFPSDELGTPGGDDLSARLVLAWNETYFFVVVHVVDDIFSPADSMAGFWNGDSIQIGFDPLRDTVSQKCNADDILLGAADFPFGPRVVTTIMPEGYLEGVPDVPFTVHRQDSNRTYIVGLPWRYLGPLNPLTDDHPFGFNLIVNENDGVRRLGWLQLADGIGQGFNASNFPAVRFVRADNDAPRVHVIADKPIVDVDDPIVITASVRNGVRSMRIKVETPSAVEVRQITLTGLLTDVSFAFDADAYRPGDVPICVTLFDSNGRELAKSSTVVTVVDDKRLARGVDRGRVILVQVDAMIAQARKERRVTDYPELRANCLRHALRVVDLAKRGYNDKDGSVQSLPDIYDRSARYVTTAAPELLDLIETFVASDPSSDLAIPDPDLLGAWTVRNGEIIADGEPIVLVGTMWMYNAMDLSAPLYAMGQNIQTIDMGPRQFMHKPFELDKDMREVKFIQRVRKNALKKQGWNEVFDLHTSPHYLPSWVCQSKWFKNARGPFAWMDTPEMRRTLDLAYEGFYRALGDIRAIKTADLANEWYFVSVSDDALADFRTWLECRHGSIDELNAVWGTDFHGFDEIPSPYPEKMWVPNGAYRRRPAFWDFCCYNTERAAELLRWMNDRFHAHYPGPLTHVKCILSSRPVRSLAQNFIMGIDPQKTLPITDLIGTDASYVRGSQWTGTLFAYDYLKSICPEKPIHSSEMHCVPYDDADAGREIRRGLFQRFIHGERINIMFLNIAFELPHAWASDFGRRWNIGRVPEAQTAYVMTCADLRRFAPVFGAFQRRKPDVLLFYDNGADFGVPGTNHPPDSYSQRALRVYETLLCHDVKVSMVTEDMLACGVHDAKMIVLAGADYVSDDTVNALAEYVERGKTVLCLDNNLRYDHYGRPRDTAMIERVVDSPRAICAAMADVSSGAWTKWFRQADLRAPLYGRDEKGQVLDGVEILSAQNDDGSRFAFMANTRRNAVLLDIRGLCGNVVDQITGHVVGPHDVKLEPDGVMLLKTSPIERKNQSQ